MTIDWHPYSHAIRQKSKIVPFSGPWAEITIVNFAKWGTENLWDFRLKGPLDLSQNDIFDILLKIGYLGDTQNSL